MLVKIETASLNQVLATRRATRAEYINRNRVLNQMWDLYDQGEMSIPKFLSCFNHVSPSFHNDYLINDPNQVIDYVTLPTHNIGNQ